MDMKHVIFIHGIGNKPSPGDLSITWLDSLSATFKDNKGYSLAADGQSSSFVYWADLFYDSYLPLNEYESERSIDDVLESGCKFEHKNSWVERLGKRFDEIETEQLIGEARYDFSKELIPIPRIAKNFIMKHFLPAVYEYLFNAEIKKEINNRVLEQIEKAKGVPITIVSHSMGTVIAYDVLSKLKVNTIENFFTLGSPLGIDEIQRELSFERDTGFPRSIRGQWINAYDRRDLVSILDRKISNDFKDNTEERIIDINHKHKGFWTHSATKYLKAKPFRTHFMELMNME